MSVLVIVFMAIVLAMGAFCTAVVCYDLVSDRNKRKKSEQDDVKAEETTPEETVCDEQTEEEKPICDEQVEEIVVTDGTEEVKAIVADEVACDDESNIAFSANTETLDEKYLALTPEFKGYYDEIVRFANTVEGVKRFKNASYEEYKVGKNRLVRLKIKRGIVVCELTIANLQFKNYVSDNKVAVKQAPIVIKVIDEASLGATKDSMMIAMRAIDEEKAYKKEQAKIRRKEKREQR